MLVLVSLHILASLVWVGGLFFIQSALTPALEEVLEPIERLAVMYRVLQRFLSWAGVSLGLLLATGYGMMADLGPGPIGQDGELMMGLGGMSAGLWVYLYLLPFRRMGKALERDNLPLATSALGQARGALGASLILGLGAALLGVATRLA